MSIAVIYRWRVKPGMEDQFVRGWSEGTRAIHERCASFGARLHRGEGDLWISYARWPDEGARKACFKDNDFRDLGFAQMRAAVAETLPEIVTTIVDDQLDEPLREAGMQTMAAKALDLGGGAALRPLDPVGDAPALYACFADESTAEFLAFAPHTSVEQTRRRLLRWSGATTPQWAIVRGDGPALGRITLVGRREGVAELGFQVAPGERRQGLASRAVCAVTRYGLEELGLVRVYGGCDPGNAASAGVFKRAGFAFEGRLKDDWVTPAGVADSLIYAATRGWTPPE